MNKMNKFISAVFLTLFVLAGTCFAQNDLLNRVPQLQETARKAAGGELGCGEGSFKLMTSRGEIIVSAGLDPIHVFGSKIAVADLLKLLEARVKSNSTGKQNSMSGEVSDLVYVILSLFAESKDPTVIPVMAKLLDDKNEVIHGWAAIALFRLAESSEDLKKKITEITFPKAAVQSAKGRGVDLPKWAKVNGES